MARGEDKTVELSYTKPNANPLLRANRLHHIPVTVAKLGPDSAGTIIRTLKTLLVARLAVATFRCSTSGATTNNIALVDGFGVVPGCNFVNLSSNTK